MPAKRHRSARRSRRALLRSIVALCLGLLATAVGLSDGQPAFARAAHQIRPLLSATGQVRRPPWWSGACDNRRDRGSYRLGANFDGLVACGPGPNEGGSMKEVQFFPGAWGEYEWECVELSMRWMYLAWGVQPYAANGNSIAVDYARDARSGPRLQLVRNGTQGMVPQPGDVLAMDDGDSEGHSEVVTSSHVDDEGNGTIGVITQNMNAPTTGVGTLRVRHFRVTASFGRVLNWLHDPAFALEEPILSEITPTGQLETKLGALQGRFRPAATGVEAGQAVGAGGMDPAPVVVALRKTGELEARQDLPEARWQVLARSGVVRFSAASGGAPSRSPEIGWLTTDGRFLLETHGLGSPAKTVATSVAQMSLGAPGSAGLFGYVTKDHRAFVEPGSGRPRLVAAGVRQLDVAGLARPREPVVAYVTTAGRAFARTGWSGPFAQLHPPADQPVRQLAVALSGPGRTAVFAYLTSGGQVYVKPSSRAPFEEAAGVRKIALVASPGAHGFPVLAVERATGWLVKSGGLRSPFVREGLSPSLSVGTLVVR